MPPITVTVAIDTEEDNWGQFAANGATCRNIARLRELQDVFDAHGARPTYLVNRPPLMEKASVAVLGDLAGRPQVEIGAHCHPWNTPPGTGAGEERSMMCALPEDANRGKIREVATRVESELGVRPTSFRAGRWALGPSVAVGLAEEGFLVDVSVSPFIDWSPIGGPDYTSAPLRPYRFHPSAPLTPDPSGSLVELPTTVGFLAGHHERAGATRTRMERSPLARLKLVGVLDRAGLLARRWLSPEHSTLDEMVRLSEAWVSAGNEMLALTFHSTALEPGATPFVHDEHDRRRFLEAVGGFLRHCRDSGHEFRTLREAGAAVRAATEAAPRGEGGAS